MGVALTAAQIVTEVYRDIDQTSSITRLDSADIPAYLNRALDEIGNSIPTRTVQAVFTGDGTTVDFDAPEPISAFHVVTNSALQLPKTSFAWGAQNNGMSFLDGWITNRGFSVRMVGDKYRFRFDPAPGSTETRTIYFLGVPGTIKETAYTTGTVSITLDSATITGSGTTWSSNAAAGDAININGYYYVIKTVSSNTSIILTELVREATASGLSYTIGGHTGLSEKFNDLIRYAVQWRIQKKIGDPSWGETKMLYDREFWSVSAQQEQLFRSNPMLGL